MPYHDSLKGRRDQCYVINGDDSDAGFVISRNIRGVGKTLTDVHTSLDQVSAAWNLERTAEHLQNLERLAEEERDKESESTQTDDGPMCWPTPTPTAMPDDVIWIPNAQPSQWEN